MKCAICQVQLCAQNRTGRCRRHPTPEAVESRAAAMRRLWQANPEHRERFKAAIKAAANTPEQRQARSERAKQGQYAARVLSTMTPERLALRNQRVSDARLAHIPSEYRAEYRRLRKAYRLTAGEAEAAIRTQVEADNARWRRKLAS